MIDTLIIDDTNWDSITVNPTWGSKGLVPRDFEKHPVGSYKMGEPYDPATMPLIPRDEWSERIADMEAQESSLEHMRLAAGIGPLNQKQSNFCWAYSSTQCVQLARMAANMPYIKLSAHSVACKVTNFRNEGGWGAASLEYIGENGVCTMDDWPANSFSRSHDTSEAWENALAFKTTESWMDFTDVHPYDRHITQDETMTCLLNRQPVIGDFSWWRHSVALSKPVELDKHRSLDDPDRWGTYTVNSWGEAWGNNGAGILKGRKGVPDGGASIRVVAGG